jgi:hypothetical protein
MVEELLVKEELSGEEMEALLYKAGLPSAKPPVTEESKLLEDATESTKTVGEVATLESGDPRVES